MEETYLKTIAALRAERNQSDQKLEELSRALERLNFEKQHQHDDLTSKLWKANQDCSQLLAQLQTTQHQLTESKQRTNQLEAENNYLHDQLRYAQATEADLRQSATHYYDKSHHLEFNLDYKNYLLSDQQELYEREVDSRADLQYFRDVRNMDPMVKHMMLQTEREFAMLGNNNNNDGLDEDEFKLDEAMNNRMVMDENDLSPIPIIMNNDDDDIVPRSPSLSPTLAPVRSNVSFVKCLRETSKLSNGSNNSNGRRVTNSGGNVSSGRMLRKLQAVNKLAGLSSVGRRK